MKKIGIALFLFMTTSLIAHNNLKTRSRSHRTERDF
jgi:hypothetical protein